MNTSCYIGDVTALHVAQLGPNPNDSVLLAGCGPVLQAYSLSDGGGLLLSQQLFEGGRIHGITTASSAKAAGDAGGSSIRGGDIQAGAGRCTQAAATEAESEAAGRPVEPRKGDWATAKGAVAQPVRAPVGGSDRVTFAVVYGGCWVKVRPLLLTTCPGACENGGNGAS